MLRLYNINLPLFDGHNWRQADSFSISRNFLQEGPNLIYPKIDHAGNLTGIVGSEFPLLNFIVFILFKLFSVNWWQGRIVNLLFSSVGTFYFYKLIDRFIDKKIAFHATIILIVSIWFAHSRKFMPDVFSSSLMIIGIYHGMIFLRTSKKWGPWLVFMIFCSLGILSKIPSAILMAFLIPEWLNKHIELKKKQLFLLGLIVISIPVLIWYYYWVPYLTEEYKYAYFYMGSDMLKGLNSLFQNFPKVLEKFYYDAMHFIAFGFAVLSSIFIIKQRKWNLAKIIVVATLFLGIYMVKAGEHFIIHSYYLVPFIPFMAIAASYTINQIDKPVFRTIVIALIILEGIGNQQHDFRSPKDQLYQLTLEEIATNHIGKDELVAVNNGLNPTMLVFLGRKGWTRDSGELSQISTLNMLFKKNCGKIIWNKHHAAFPKTLLKYDSLYENEHFVILDVSSIN